MTTSSLPETPWERSGRLLRAATHENLARWRSFMKVGLDACKCGNIRETWPERPWCPDCRRRYEKEQQERMKPLTWSDWALLSPSKHDSFGLLDDFLFFAPGSSWELLNDVLARHETELGGSG